MKNVMRAFYSDVDRAKEVWESPNTLFIFDTNILRKLYSYAEQTRDDFFALLEEISDKIWIPYHVALEYQLGRLSAIKEEKAVFRDLNKILEGIDGIFTNDITKLDLATRFPKLSSNTESLHKKIKQLVTGYKKSVEYWDKKQPCVRGHDTIRDKIDELFDNKVGRIPPSQKWLDDIYSEGKIRFENKTPPGYKDKNKSSSKDPFFEFSNLKYDRQYSDLIIWKQIIEHSKDDSIKNVIFITNDLKDDWWYIINSSGDKRIGYDARLKEEIYKDANIIFFQMYDMLEFFEYGKQFLSIPISEASIHEAKQSISTNEHISLANERRHLKGFDKHNKFIKLYSEHFANMPEIDESLCELFGKTSQNTTPINSHVLEILKEHFFNENINRAYDTHINKRDRLSRFNYIKSLTNTKADSNPDSTDTSDEDDEQSDD